MSLKRFRFGQDIVYEVWFIDEDGKRFTPSADAPNIIVYKEKPSYDDVIDGTITNQVGSTITSWSDTASPVGGKYFTIPAIDDPSPTADSSEESYYIGVRYTLKASEQYQALIEPLWLMRSYAHNQTLKVQVTAVVEVYPQIQKYLSADQLVSKIEEASDLTMIDLKKRGLKIDKILRTDELNLAVAYRAIEEAMAVQFTSPGDQSFARMELYRRKYKEIMDGLELPYTATQDGVVTETVQAATSTVLVRI